VNISLKPSHASSCVWGYHKKLSCLNRLGDQFSTHHHRAQQNCQHSGVNGCEKSVNVKSPLPLCPQKHATLLCGDEEWRG
ncbi:MAG: hypothetical protein ACK40X_14950, partial [Armatimonadota bacterium]